VERDPDVRAGGYAVDFRGEAFDVLERHVRHLGMSGAGSTTANHLGLDHRVVPQASPGRAVLLFSANDSARMMVSLSFATDSALVDRLDRARQGELVRDEFTGAGWEVPHLFGEMETGVGTSQALVGADTLARCLVEARTSGLGHAAAVAH